MTKYFDEHELRIINEAKKVAAIKYYVRHGLKSRESVKRLINKVLPVKASSRCMCNQKDHISQLDFLCEVLLNHLDMYVLWANRAGSKTFFIALEVWIKCLLNEKLECRILGGSGDQSRQAYKATQDFWAIGNECSPGGNPLEIEYLKKPPMEEKTFFKNGSSIKILMASQHSVRGPHPQRLCLDEIDVMNEDILQAALSQPSSNHGIPACTSMSSTNHIASGLMDEQLEKAASNPNARIFKWCIWDVLEACTDYQCNTCDLFPYCPGEQMKQATGYYKIKDFIQKLYQLSAYTLNVEWLCKKIGHPDLIYKNEFDEDIHLVDVPFNIQKMGYVSIDWGGIHPFTFGFWQFVDDLNAYVRIDEVILNPDKDGAATNKRLIEIVRKKPYWNHFTEGVADPSRADLRAEWAQVGKNIYAADNRVDVGIERVKACLKPVLGYPKIYINKSCKISRNEILSYKYNPKTGQPIKENDHTPDEIRYFAMWKIGEPSGKTEIITKKKDKLDELFKGGNNAGKRKGSKRRNKIFTG